MKQTLLEIVQDVLNDMDSDEVNSISDTVESEQIAAIVKRSYINLISTRNWPHLSKLLQFSPVTDYTRPTLLALPDGIKELEILNYDVRKVGETKRDYREIQYLEPIEFLNKLNQRDSDSDSVDIINSSTADGVELLIDKTKKPEYWTSFNDKEIVFDSYDQEVDSVIQNSKVQAKAYMTPTWVMSDDHIPDLPAEAFSNLVEEAKSTAFLVLKQMANQKAEANAQRQARWLSRKAWSAKGGITFERYGRGRGGRRTRDITFKQD